MCRSKSASKATGRLELADIFREHGQDFLRTHRLSLGHRKVMQQIMNCRTAVLGGHHQSCARCGFQKYRYHSCRNRHCPKCQTAAKEAWRAARQLELLPVPYFHNVFTLPHEINPLILKSETNQRLLLKLLFDATAETLLEFGRGEFKGKVGFTSVLHTWDQQLRPHYHVHCLIAAGALQEGTAGEEDRWIAGGRQFLFSVRALSKMFRAKFLVGMKQLFESQSLDLPEPLTLVSVRRQLLKQLWKKGWVVYSKAPFAGPAKLLDYLSRYTHRVAITNSRLIGCSDGKVTFSFRDRRDGDRRKQLTLPTGQFIGRFLTHVLPSRFMRIRHYEYLANRYKRERLTKIRLVIGARPQQAFVVEPAARWLMRVLGIDSELCPNCGDQLIEQPIPNPLSFAASIPHTPRQEIANPRGPPT